MIYVRSQIHSLSDISYWKSNFLTCVFYDLKPQFIFIKFLSE
jgi:hypothetical protein